MENRKAILPLFLLNRLGRDGLIKKAWQLPARTSRAAVFEVECNTIFRAISMPQKLLAIFRPSFMKTAHLAVSRFQKKSLAATYFPTQEQYHRRKRA